MRALFDKLAVNGTLLVVVDQPTTIGALPVAVARAAGHQVAYLPGLAMRRIAGIAPGHPQLRHSIKGEHPARTGNRKLKRAFLLAAFASLSDSVSRVYYDRKRAEGRNPTPPLICLASTDSSGTPVDSETPRPA